MAENGKIVIRHMDDGKFQRTVFPRLMRELVEATHATRKSAGAGGEMTETCQLSGKTGAP